MTSNAKKQKSAELTQLSKFVIHKDSVPFHHENITIYNIHKDSVPFNHEKSAI